MRMTPLMAALCAVLFATPAFAQDAACHPTRDEALASAKEAAKAVGGTVITIDKPLAQAAMNRAAESAHAQAPEVSGMIIVEFARDGETTDLVGMISPAGCLTGIAPVPHAVLMKLLGPAA